MSFSRPDPAAPAQVADATFSTGRRGFDQNEVRDFLRISFEHVGLDWEKYVRFDERYLRPTEVDNLIGDASKAEKVLGWKPTTFTPDLARLMVDADRELLGA